MKFWQLFSIPEGKEITEKNLYRVLICSLCSIFLCMSCLVGTTWAWFVVSVENPDNVIQVAIPSVVVVTEHPVFLPEGDELTEIEIGSETEFPAGEYIISISHPGEGDSFDQKSTLYVTFSVDEVVMGYVTLNYDNDYEAEVLIQAEQDCIVTWVVSWFPPDSAEPILDDLIYWSVEEEPVIPEDDDTNTDEDESDDEQYSDDPVSEWEELVPSDEEDSFGEDNQPSGEEDSSGEEDLPYDDGSDAESPDSEEEGTDVTEADYQSEEDQPQTDET